MTENEKTNGTVKILKVEGKLDADNSAETENRLNSAISEKPPYLLLDLSGMEYLSSAGLRTLLSTAKLAQKADSKLALAAPVPQVRKILDLARFNSISPIFDSVEGALASLDAPSPNRAAEPASLSIAEEIYLMALDDERGILKPLPVSALDYALAGALLMELALRNRIDSDLSSLKLVSSEPTSDPLLDDAIAELSRKAEPRPTSFWLEQFADESERIEERVLARLIKKGILKQENQRVLWVFAARRYPLIEDREVKEVRSRLRDLILSSEIPDPRDVILISLGNACRLLDDLFTTKEHELARQRISNLSQLDLIGQQMSQAIRAIEQAMNAAISTHMVL